MTPLHGLTAATHTPFTAAGDLDLTGVERQAAHLRRVGVATVFIGGSTGECHSLTLAERLALAERWVEAARSAPLRVVVHVGANCLGDSRTLATHAAALGAAAIAAQAPSYFRPESIEALVACCAEIAAAAPALPFYYYDIPSMTGVRLPVPAFLEAADGRIPSLAGVKFSNPDLLAYQQCLHAGGGRFDVPFGSDEYLLAALALGARGGVGSSYNFAAPLYHRLLGAFAQGDLEAARAEQWRSAQLIALLAGYGYAAASRVVMGLLGVPVGPPRLPLTPLTPEREAAVAADLQRLGFFDWL